MVNINKRKNAEEKLEEVNKDLVRTNKRLKQLTLRDAQTGLYNYRYLEDAIESEFHRAKRYELPLSAIVLDIDYFKSINDVYGLKFGDLVLKQFSRLLKKTLRRYDIVVRTGGEEFLILSPGVDRPSAVMLAERISEATSLCNFGDRNHIVELRLSIAVISFPEDKIVKALDFIEFANHVLEIAKKRGGNCICSSLDITKEDQPTIEDKVEDLAEIRFLREKIDKLTKSSNQSLIEAVFGFVKTIKLKDRYTGEHVERMVHYSTEIANALSLPRGDIELIRQASVLHDLGKIGIGEKILLKSKKLNRKEFNEIKKHPQIGVDIIRPIQFLHSIIPLILYHHERWDGNGYPRGLRAEEIPIGARIVAVADVYQALISDRPYRRAYSKQEAIEIIIRGAGTHFDPKIVSIFLEILRQE
jgi:diguanylate cyclase (GGDEF)-like protein